jgi:aminoglycoside/choline kinase family phosphotransferase
MLQTSSTPATFATPVTSSDILWPSPERAALFKIWLAALAPKHHLQISTLRAASADASFRRYFRIDGPSLSQSGHASPSFIIMDAPPDKEDSAPFVRIAGLLDAAGLLVPQILDWHAEHGFMLLSDLGTKTMLDVLDKQAGYEHTSSTVSSNLPLYDQALDALVAWQLASKPAVLPPYDEALLRRELQLFPDWYIAKHKNITLTAGQQAILDKAYSTIVTSNLASPSVFVHRDFMPRNLMAPYPELLKNAAPQQMLGVLDFQDAVYGPITYDIASLMRDAFLSWEEDFVLDVTIRYWQKAKAAGLPMLDEWMDDFGAFYKAVEWMGLQRHLKILGIFARLTLRDGKPKYLADTPRFIAYVRHTCNRYIELKPLLRLIDEIEAN